jgi:arylsulfatase
MSENWENVILLSADALRADHLSCYGYHRETSPVLDELTNESIRFENAYSVSSHTREAVPALLTGEYPDVAVDSGYHLASETMASTLSAEGFATAAFHSNPFISRAYGFDEGFDHFDDDLHLSRHKLITLAQRAIDKLRNRHYARAEEINERALSWIDSLEENQPFFLWAHYLDTHGPYEPPGKYRTLYANRRVSDREAQSLYKRAINDPESIIEDERRLLIDLYDAEIRYNDKRIGEFLEALQERGLVEKTLVVFTSDHGEAFGERGYYEHPRRLHKELTQVPLIVRAPTAKSEEVYPAVSSLDISETILKSAIDTLPGDAPLFMRIADDRVVFSQALDETGNENVRRYSAQTSDSACFCDIYSKSSNAKFRNCSNMELRRKLESHIDSRTSTFDTRKHNEDGDIDEEIDRRLSALGYK